MRFRKSSFDKKLELVEHVLSQRGIFYRNIWDENLSRLHAMEATQEAVPSEFAAKFGEGHPTAWSCTGDGQSKRSVQVYFVGGAILGTPVEKIDVGKAIVQAACDAGLSSDWSENAGSAVHLRLDHGIS